jgi:ABC-type transport system substrate-binding protein
MNSKKLFALVIVFAMTFALFAGCGNKTEPATEDAASSDGSPVETGDEGAGPVIRDAVNIAVTLDDTWDPFNHTAKGPDLVFQFLGYMVDNEYVPALMKDYKYSDDGLTIYCELFDYITDSAGNKITAKDVEWSYNTGLEGTTVTVTDI